MGKIHLTSWDGWNMKRIPMMKFTTPMELFRWLCFDLLEKWLGENPDALGLRSSTNVAKILM
ncbi:hypothetical protein F8388_006295 [Cannabis sativa]|uniref:Uncharacterized protein n=1 Tax=Cannabis sativa TaxID=3483 RepID=A0A7J6EDZ7_CANSA|nr:hypothetical protein F8388_006295 [Cannabis sativa]